MLWIFWQSQEQWKHAKKPRCTILFSISLRWTLISLVANSSSRFKSIWVESNHRVFRHQKDLSQFKMWFLEKVPRQAKCHCDLISFRYNNLLSKESLDKTKFRILNLHSRLMNPTTIQIEIIQKIQMELFKLIEAKTWLSNNLKVKTRHL